MPQPVHTVVIYTLVTDNYCSVKKELFSKGELPVGPSMAVWKLMVQLELFSPKWHVTENTAQWMLLVSGLPLAERMVEAGLDHL